MSDNNCRVTMCISPTKHWNLCRFTKSSKLIYDDLRKINIADVGINITYMSHTPHSSIDDTVYWRFIHEHLL